MNELFGTLSSADLSQFEKEAAQKYAPHIVKRSNHMWRQYSAEQKQAILDEGNQLYADIVALMPLGAKSHKVQALVARWRHHMAFFWTPTLEQLQGLADLYQQDERFKAHFDRLHPDLAEFMGRAVAVYVKRHTP